MQESQTMNTPQINPTFHPQNIKYNKLNKLGPVNIPIQNITCPNNGLFLKKLIRAINISGNWNI